MTMTLEIVAQRIEALEKQMAILMAEKAPKAKTKPEKPEKKTKKPKSDDEDEKPKSKRVSGYILYSKATRDEVKDMLTTEQNDDDVKIKSTDIMKALGKMWKELSEEEREQWNAKAKEMKDGSYTD